MRRWLRPLVSGGLLVILFLVLPWQDVRAAVSRVPVWLWLTVLAGFLLGHRAGVAKWRLLVNAGRARLSTRDAVRFYAAGLFANLCLPTVVGGDVVRAALAARATGRTEAAVFGGAADRMIDVAVTALLIVVGAITARNRFPGSMGDALAAGILALVLAVAALVPILVRRPLARWPRRIRRRAGRSMVVLRRMRRAPGAVAAAVAISLAMQSGFVLLNAWLGAYVGVHVPLAVWFFVWPLAKIAGLLPISLGGLAVRDATLGALLLPVGVPLAVGVVAALVWQSVMIAGGLVGGIVWWLSSGRRVALRDVTAAARTEPAVSGVGHA